MKTSNLALLVTSALAFSIGTASVNAASNPFAIKSLSSGYQVADAGTKMKDGKCGTGQCSASMKKAKADEMKKGEMAAEATPAADKMKDGACSADMKKSTDGKCSAEMK